MKGYIVVILCFSQVLTATVFFDPYCLWSVEDKKEPLEGDRIALGYMTNGFLFSSILPSIDPRGYAKEDWPGRASDSTAFEINKAPLLAKAQVVNYPIGPTVPRDIGIPHWRIDHGCYWSSVGSLWYTPEIERIMLQDMSLLDPRNKSPKAVKRQKDRQLDLLFDPPTDFSPGSFVRKESLDKYQDFGLTRYSGIYEDFLPISENSVLDFINWDGTVRTWRGKVLKDEKEGRWYTDWNPKVDETIDAGFSEPFYVWAKGTDLFFVTRSGKLYHSQKPASGKRKAAPIWTDGRSIRGPYYDRESGRWIDQGSDKNPIRGLIFDPASGKGYAFTRPKPEDKDQKPMYFEIKSPLTPRPYPGFKLDKPPDSYTLRTLMEYAQFLIDKKEIKVKP